MADYGDQIILDTAQEISEPEANKNNPLQKLSSITGSIPNKAEHISCGQYITEFDPKNTLQSLINYSRYGINRGTEP